MKRLSRSVLKGLATRKLLVLTLTALCLMGANPIAVSVNVAPNSIISESLSGTTFTAGTAGTVGNASAALGSGSFSGSFSLKTTGVDHSGTSCTSNSVFSISGAGVLSVTSAGAVQSYPGVCVVATQAGLANYVQAFILTGTTVTSGGCPGGDSGFVPAGFTCFISDEFNGTSIDTSKWDLSNPTTPPGQSTVSDGSFHLWYFWDGTQFNGNGLGSRFILPDGPMYAELHIQFPNGFPHGFEVADWDCGASDARANSHWCQPVANGQVNVPETDWFDSLGSEDSFSNAVCPGWTLWNNGSNFGFSGQCGGPNPSPIFDGNFHILSILRDPSPAPDGTLTFKVDGVTIVGPVDVGDQYHVFPSRGNGGGDTLIFSAPCTNSSVCAQTIQQENVDYVRVYCVSGQSC